VSLAQRRAAARNSLAATVVALALPVTTARAGGLPDLLLPLGTAASLVVADKAERPPPLFGSSPSSPSSSSSGGVPHQRLGFMPSYMHIPDLYSQEIDVNLPKYVEIVDNDRLVSLDLLRHRQQGWMVSVAYDEEQKGNLPGGSVLFSLTAELKF
jgi:hypothetical protein